MTIHTSAQGDALSAGSIMVTGLANFTNSTVEWMESNDIEHDNDIQLDYSANYFIANKLFVGAGVDYSNYFHKEYKSKFKGIGPNLGYAFGKPGRSIFSYAMIGYRFDKQSSKNYRNIGSTRNPEYEWEESISKGSTIFLSYGLVFRLKEHIGLVTEFSYGTWHLDAAEDWENGSGEDFFEVSIGFTGLFY